MAAYFAFEQAPDEEFVFELQDDKLIEHARRLVSGETSDQPHVMGRIVKRKQPYNPNWDFHLDPDTIRFFDSAIEVCDADMRYVEDHLEEACGAFLPGCTWCPWSSKVVREVTQPVTT